MQPVPRPVEPVDQPQSPTVCRVLVVDDNRHNADGLALLVNLWGHRACVAYDGPGALRLAEEHRPEVVFLDLGLPGMSGYEVARRLRQEAALLVAVTGYGPEQDGGRCQQAGFDLHLTKPVDLGVLQELLARRGQSPPSADATSR